MFGPKYRVKGVFLTVEDVRVKQQSDQWFGRFKLRLRLGVGESNDLLLQQYLLPRGQTSSAIAEVDPSHSAKSKVAFAPRPDWTDMRATVIFEGMEIANWQHANAQGPCFLEVSEAGDRSFVFWLEGRLESMDLDLSAVGALLDAEGAVSVKISVRQENLFDAKVQASAQAPSVAGLIVASKSASVEAQIPL